AMLMQQLDEQLIAAKGRVMGGPSDGGPGDEEAQGCINVLGQAVGTLVLAVPVGGIPTAAVLKESGRRAKPVLTSTETAIELATTDAWRPV
ncbi:hypothetical protein ACSNOK_34320, partial [Streptomyces sp. URMC 126]|uniref:hypothetical protein n=1 Tax=Streptomyces sp. URMC 126 TaxID=3423401 RepID=UPI003F1A0D3C